MHLWRVTSKLSFSILIVNRLKKGLQIFQILILSVVLLTNLFVRVIVEQH